MLKNKQLFLRWWLFFSLLQVGIFIAIQNNIHKLIWEADFTYLSWVILIVFGYACNSCGAQSWKLCKQKLKVGEFKKVKRAIDRLWFISDMLMSIGLVGTLVGFVYMLGGFSQAEASDTQSIQVLLQTIGSAASTALYTTLTGLICSILLKIQCFTLSSHISKLKILDKNNV